jgi:hypothetical protein
MALRPRGEEVFVNIVRSGVLENTFTAISSFHGETTLEIIEKGYLGEKSNRHDSIYNGSKGSIEMDLQTQDWYTFLDAVKARAKMETPDIQISISKTILFPNGDTPTITYVDVQFGPIPEDTGARNNYVKVKLDWACDEVNTTLS